MKILSLFGLITLGALSALSACSSSEPASDEAAATEDGVNASEDDAAANANENTNENANISESINAAVANATGENAEGEGEESLDDFSFLDDVKGGGASAEAEPSNENLLAENAGFEEGDENFNANAEGQTNANGVAINSANLAGEDIGEDPTAADNASLTNLEGGGADEEAVAAAEANAFNSANAVVAQQTPAIDDTESVAEVETPPPPPASAESDGSIAPISNIPAQGAAPAPAPEELEPVTAMVNWVGYRIDEKGRKLQVEIVAKGRPEYEIFEESNRKGQKEIVIRFYQAGLRKKLRWEINSSEFRSPVAYIRMRDFKEKGVVDVVLTHRDPLLPEFFEKDGKFLLNYTVPDRYFGNEQKSVRVVKDKAQILAKGPAQSVGKVQAKTGKLPVTGFTRISFKEKPLMQPIRNWMKPARVIKVDRHGLPENFDRRLSQPNAKRTGLIWSRYTWIGVAQDNLEEDFADEAAVEEEAVNEGNDANAEENSGNIVNAANSAEEGGNEAENEENSENTGNANAESENENANAGNGENVSNTNGNAGANAEAADEFSNGSFEGAEQNAFSNLNGNAAANESNGNGSGNFGNQAAEGNNGNVSANNVPLEGNTPEPEEEATEITGEDNTQAQVKYTGKPVYMEFYESPLSMVLKTFSEETGNNFVFSSEIGSLPVSVNFKGVPWDEALKAILETHSLGMVRIGKNVVRIDLIANLTQYMASLEQAKQFEARRVPTKVMVFRLNNAVAKDVNDRLKILMGRDIELDPRIKIQDDVRTNALVMEAPEVVLAKAKAIVERLDLETPQVEIASRIVEVTKTQSDFLGFAWGNNLNFDPGRALGFGTLNFPNSIGSNFAVDPGVVATPAAGTGRFRFGSLNKFLDLDLLLKMEEKKGTTNVLQSNRVLVLDGQKALILAGNSQFFRPAAGGNVINPAPGAAPAEGAGLSEVTFNLQLEVTPQVTALGSVIMNLLITSDTPGDPTGEALATKNTRRLETQMVRSTGDTGVIGGIYDTKRTQNVTGIPLLSSIPILGALFRSTTTTESQTELLIMVTPTIVSGPTQGGGADSFSVTEPGNKTVIGTKSNGKAVQKGRL